MFGAIFWTILGLGIAIPFTLVIVINLTIKARAGDNYELNLRDLGVVYFIALLGWAIFISEVVSQ